MALGFPRLDPITGLPSTFVMPKAAQQRDFNAGTSNAGGYTPGRGLSTTEIYRQRENTPMAYNAATGQRTPVGTKLFHAGWNTSGVGPGTDGYRGTGRIGSAAGAVGSAGVPTSQRGRAEKYGDAFAEMPTWAMSELMRDNMGGLSQDWRFGTMGQVPASAPGIRGAGGPVTGQPPTVAENSNDPWAGRTSYGDPNITPKTAPAPSNADDWFRDLLKQFLPSNF